MELDDFDTYDWLDLFDQSGSSCELLQTDIDLGDLLSSNQDFGTDEFGDNDQVLGISLFDPLLSPETITTLPFQPTDAGVSSDDALLSRSHDAFTFSEIPGPPEHASINSSIDVKLLGNSLLRLDVPQRRDTGVQTDATETETTITRALKPEAGAFINFSLSNRILKARKKRQISEQRRSEIREMRIVGSCVLCRQKKRSVCTTWAF
jgi:hypothetical protein